MALAFPLSSPSKLNIYKWILPLFVLGALYLFRWLHDPLVVLYASLALFLLPFLCVNRTVLIFFTLLSFYFTQSSVSLFYTVFGYARWLFLGLCLIITGLEFLRKKNPPVGRDSIPRWILILFAAGSLAFSVSPLLTVERTVGLLCIFLAIPLLIKPYVAAHGIDKFIQVLLFAVFPLYLFSILFIRSGFSYMGGNQDSAPSFQALQQNHAFRQAYGLGDETALARFRGLFQNPNTVGIVTALLFPFVLYQCFQEKNRKFYLLFAGLMLLSLILSGSREGLGTCLVSGLFVTIRYYGFGKLLKKYISKLLPAVILLGVLFMILLRNGFLDRYLRLWHFLLLGGRLEAWIAAIQLILARPWFGYGFGTEEVLFKRAGYVFLFHEGAAAHNAYLGIVMQLGIFGLLLFFGPLIYLFFSELRVSKPSGPRIALQGMLLSGFMVCITESWIYAAGNSQALPFWAGIGALEYLRYKEKYPDGLDSSPTAQNDKRTDPDKGWFRMTKGKPEASS